MIVSRLNMILQALMLLNSTNLSSKRSDGVIIFKENSNPALLHFYSLFYDSVYFISSVFSQNLISPSSY